MNGRAAILALAAAGLTALVVFELSGPTAALIDPAPPSGQLSTLPSPASTQSIDRAAIVETLLARPLFIQTRRPPAAASRSASASSSPLPRMTAILIDGTRRSAIFATPSDKPGGEFTVVAEGGRIGPFTVETIGSQQVIVLGPEGKRNVRTSFDPDLQPPAAASPYISAAPQLFAPAPSLATPNKPALIVPRAAPRGGYILPQAVGVSR